MKIEIVNQTPHTKATVTHKDDGNVVITLTEERRKALKDVKAGSVIKLGDREWVVLGQSNETAALITADKTTNMVFGKDRDYRTSKVRDYCNTAIYNELCSAIGKENIIRHTVNLTARDGTGKKITCRDDVSLLTEDLYRRYREFLPATGYWYWLANPASWTAKDYDRYVCCVNSSGVPGWDYCDCDCDVRPFCILKSSILVDVVEDDC